MTATPPKHAKAKLVLIPVLAIVLIAVLWQPKNVEDAGAEQPAVAVSEIAPTEVSAPAEAVSLRWPTADLAAAVEFNPFAPLGAISVAESPHVASAESQAALAAPTLQSIRADAVIQRNGRSFACIDGQLAAVGDTLASGSRVLSISLDAVVVERPQRSKLLLDSPVHHESAVDVDRLAGYMLSASGR